MSTQAYPTVVAAVGLAAAGCSAAFDDAFCATEGCGFSAREWELLSSLANPPDPPPDLSNAVWANPLAVQLGHKFFFDARFSGPPTNLDPLGRPSLGARSPDAFGNPAISCASCHDLVRGGADTTSVPGHVSVGVGSTDVNAITVYNAAYRPLVFWNGRADSLWALNAVVAESGTTMGGNRLKTARVIVSYYWQEFTKVFPDAEGDLIRIINAPPDGRPGNKADCQLGDPTEPFQDAFDCLPPETRDAATRILVNWSKAIAAFEHQLVSRDSAFDRFVAGGPTSRWLTPAAKRGARLFVGKAACVNCHNGPMLADGDFHNLAVPQTGPGVPTPADCPERGRCDCVAGKNCLPWGAFDGLGKLAGSKFLRTSQWSSDPTDQSRASYLQRAAAPSEGLKGAWRTPSLRDVSLTAPYMHDGALATLRDVVAHYDTGGRWLSGATVGAPSASLKPLRLSDDEAADLVAFLESLTGAPLPTELLTPPVLP